MIHAVQGMSTQEMPWGNCVVEKLKAPMEARIEATTNGTPLSLPTTSASSSRMRVGARPGIRQALALSAQSFSATSTRTRTPRHLATAFSAVHGPMTARDAGSAAPGAHDVPGGSGVDG